MLSVLYNNMFSYEESTVSKTDIRSSSMPFCPRKFIFSHFKEFRLSYRFFFYVDIGTAIHSAVQDWIGKANKGVLYGNWECKRCNYVLLRKVGPIPCPYCTKELTYKEITLRVNSFLNGHCDGILLHTDERNPIKTNKDLLKVKFDASLMELKSTSSYSIKSKTEPDKNHQAQAIIYGVGYNEIAKRLGLKIKIVDCIIKYISRDSPNVVSKDLVVDINNPYFYNMTKNIITQTVDSLLLKDYKYFLKTRPCTFPIIGEYYEKCEFDSVCNIYDSDFKNYIRKVHKMKQNFFEFKKSTLFC